MQGLDAAAGRVDLDLDAPQSVGVPGQVYVVEQLRNAPVVVVPDELDNGPIPRQSQFFHVVSLELDLEPTWRPGRGEARTSRGRLEGRLAAMSMRPQLPLRRQ